MLSGFPLSTAPVSTGGVLLLVSVGVSEGGASVLTVFELACVPVSLVATASPVVIDVSSASAKPAGATASVSIVSIKKPARFLENALEIEERINKKFEA